MKMMKKIRFTAGIAALCGSIIIVGLAVTNMGEALQAPAPSVLDQVSVEQLTQGPQGPPYVPQGPIAIVGGLLIDATAAPPRHDQTVLIDGEPYDGENDFTDEELDYIIKRGHELGKIIDVHAGGGGNAGLRRMLAFDVDTLSTTDERCSGLFAAAHRPVRAMADLKCIATSSPMTRLENLRRTRVDF